MHCRLVSPQLLYFLELLSSLCFFHEFFFILIFFVPLAHHFTWRHYYVVRRISSVFIFHHIFWHFVSTCCSLRPFISVTCVNVVFFSTNTRSAVQFTVMIKKIHTLFWLFCIWIGKMLCVWILIVILNCALEMKLFLWHMCVCERANRWDCPTSSSSFFFSNRYFPISYMKSRQFRSTRHSVSLSVCLSV